MDLLKTKDLLRAMDDLQNSLGFLNGEGPGGMGASESLAAEAVVLNLGGDEEIVAFWKSKDPKYFHNKAGDFVRRHIVLQQNRASLYPALSELAWPLWSLDDVFTIPAGPSALRAQLLTHPPEELVPTGDFDYCREEEGEPHRLLLAVALGDPLSVSAVERTPWIMDATSASEEARVRGEGALMWLMKCPGDKASMEFGLRQWRLAQQSGLWGVGEAPLDARSARLATHLRCSSRSSLDMLSSLAFQTGTPPPHWAEGFREMAWALPADLATALWSEKYASRQAETLRKLPPASGAPFLSIPDNSSDPFLAVLKKGGLVSGAQLFDQWENPSFDADRVAQQVPAWRSAIANMVLQASPAGVWSLATTRVVQDVPQWLLSDDAWPLAHLPEAVGKDLLAWSARCAEAIQGLSLFQDVPAGQPNPEFRAALLDIPLLSNGLTSAPIRKPRF